MQNLAPIACWRREKYWSKKCRFLAAEEVFALRCGGSASMTFNPALLFCEQNDTPSHDLAGNAFSVTVLSLVAMFVVRVSTRCVSDVFLCLIKKA